MPQLFIENLAWTEHPKTLPVPLCSEKTSSFIFSNPCKRLQACEILPYLLEVLIYGINIYIYIYIYACVYLRCTLSDKSLSFFIWTKLGCNYASSSILHCTALIPCIPYHRNNNKSMKLDGSYDYLVDLYKRYTRYTRMVWYCMMQPLIPWQPHSVCIRIRVLAVMCSIHYWTPNEARTSITASNLISPRPLPLPLPLSLPRPRKSPLSLPPPHLRYFVIAIDQHREKPNDVHVWFH